MSDGAENARKNHEEGEQTAWPIAFATFSANGSVKTGLSPSALSDQVLSRDIDQFHKRMTPAQPLWPATKARPRYG